MTTDDVTVSGAVEEALPHAQHLATWIWKAFYKDDAPDWRPFDNVTGVLTQIDNMISGMQRKPLSSPSFAQGAEAVAWRIKDFADGWIYTTNETVARTHREAGHLVQVLYAAAPPPSSPEPQKGAGKE